MNPALAHPPAVKLLEARVVLTRPEKSSPFHGHEPAQAASRPRRSNRRTHRRLSPDDFQWLKAARLKYGPQVRVIDISAGGMLIETEKRLERDSKMVLELAGAERTVLVACRVLRCDPEEEHGRRRYRAACAFSRALDFPDLVAETHLTESVASDIVAGLDALGERGVAHRKVADTAPIHAALAHTALAHTAPAHAVPAHTVPAHTAPPHIPPADALLAPGAWQKVIVRYRDGQLLRGYTNNFHANRPQLHLSEGPCSGSTVMVPLSRLKALFFVREFAGDPRRVEKADFGGRSSGRKVEITFHDGEVLLGSTISYRQDGNGFFVQPADAQSNNLRVFVILGAIQHLRFL